MLTRRTIWMLGLCLLLWPAAAWAQVVDLTGTWDTMALVTAGPDTGATFVGWIDFSSGGVTIVGTFQATVAGVLTSGTINGARTDGQFHGVMEATSPSQYQLTLDATVASDGQTFSGTWSDTDGRSGSYQGTRRTAMRTDTLPESGAAPWGLLLAAGALLSVVLLSRGVRKLLKRRKAWLKW